MSTLAETFALALQHHHTGNLRQAKRLYLEVLQTAPGHADAHHSLGVLACQVGRFEEAATWLRQALALAPQSAVYHANLGVALEGMGALNEAAASYRRALQMRPTDADSHYNLGNILRRQEKWDEAVGHYHKALQLRPGYAKAHCNLGLALAAQGKLDEAVSHYQEALRLDPGSAETHNNLGVALTELDRLEEAVAHLRDSVKINPAFAEGHHSLGCVLQKLAKLNEAIQCYHQAIQLNQNYTEAHWNHSLLRLLRGEFEEGWPEYEWRWTQPGFTKHHEGRPHWDGSSLRGKTILLHAEQGLGDTMQMIRYAPLVRKRAGQVVFECQPPLLRMLRDQPGIDLLVPQGSPLPAFDVQAPLLSLPGILQTSLKTIPESVPYFHADAQLMEYWKSAMGHVRSAKLENEPSTSHSVHRTSHFFVGIAWQGNPKYRGDRQRSIPLRYFERLAQVPGVRLVSLQRSVDGGRWGVDDAYLPSTVHNIEQLDETSGTFMDTAALMRNLDLVISSDTAITHLAGALGVPVWVVLPLVPDWRWLLERDDSPWYPTMRLFRQTRYGCWDDVFERVAEELNRRKKNEG